jgi:L-ribulose-5-phosphate 3-epimerase
MTRRDFIVRSGAGASLLGGLHLPGNFQLSNVAGDDDAFKISVFSKNLQWLDYEGMAREAAALGFDGVDLTVRPGGHVLPENVERDLPAAVNAVEKKGLKVFSIVTAIDNAEDSLSVRVLETAKKLGIRHYRLGWFHYDEKLPIRENLKKISARFTALEALNKRIGIHGAYQNHEGHYFGAPVWDLAKVFEELKPSFTGSQYDVYHAVVEGAHSWVYGFELLAPYIKTINIKDFRWEKKDGKWDSQSVPLGEGVVDLKQYMNVIRNAGIRCPISIHYEYPLGGADQGASKITVEGAQVLTAMKKDLEYVKQLLRDAGLK